MQWLLHAKTDNNNCDDIVVIQQSGIVFTQDGIISTVIGLINR